MTMDENRLWALFWMVAGFVAIVTISLITFYNIERSKVDIEIARIKAAAVCRCHEHCVTAKSDTP